MKISILQGAFFPVPPIMGGAVEKIWSAMGKQFAARGCEVTHISRQHPQLPREEVIEGVHHVRVKGYNTPRSLARLKLLDLLYTLRARRVLPEADIVVTNTFWAPMLLHRRHGRIYVSVERFPKGQMRFYTKASRFRACSQVIERALNKELPVSMRRRVRLIANPLPFPPLQENVLRDKKPVILYCGRIHPEKGLDLLVQAAAKLDWPTKVVGPFEISQGGGGAPYLESLRRMAAKTNARISFDPPVFDSNELSVLYRNASIFVYPTISDKGEAGPMAPREAMAHGCVPVVSSLDCFSDLVSHRRNGLTFDHRGPDGANQLANELQSLISDPIMRQRLGLAAWEVNQTHAPGHIADLLLKDFNSLLG
jgi:glycosyltransferase involved in cell wall biosynthesis